MLGYPAVKPGLLARAAGGPGRERLGPLTPGAPVPTRRRTPTARSSLHLMAPQAALLQCCLQFLERAHPDEAHLALLALSRKIGVTRGCWLPVIRPLQLLLRSACGRAVLDWPFLPVRVAALELQLCCAQAVGSGDGDERLRWPLGAPPAAMMRAINAMPIGPEDAGIAIEVLTGRTFDKGELPDTDWHCFLSAQLDGRQFAPTRMQRLTHAQRLRRLAVEYVERSSSRPAVPLAA